MRRSIPVHLAAAALAALAVGCESQKSSNPTSPSVAGPIPGVNITAPVLLEPSAGARIRAQDQPLTLLIENATTNGERPISLTFEIATDTDFNNRVFARENISPGPNGRTSLRLPDALAADRTYYWRARALDGANTGPFSNPVGFQIYTPVELQAPTPLAPVGDIKLATRRPEFSVRNSVRSGPVGAVTYVFEISENQTFTVVEAVVTLSEQPVETRFTIAQELKTSQRYFWRARASDPETTSAWSAVQIFQTPDPAPAPTPTPTPTPAPPAGGWPTSGPEIVTYVEQRYPQYLRCCVSLDERKENMAFIRDRMIEAGICGGLDLAWNMKRGGPEKSIDYLAYRKNGTWIGVDIGFDYDNTSMPLRLQWGEDGPLYIFPETYLPRPACR